MQMGACWYLPYRAALSEGGWGLGGVAVVMTMAVVIGWHWWVAGRWWWAAAVGGTREAGARRGATQGICQF